MIPELGHFAVILALVVACVQGVVPLVGATLGQRRLMAVARSAAYTQFGFMGLAFLVLIYCFLSNDFTVEYVANHSNTYLPDYYKVSAVWGGHEGSLLLWALILGGWAAAVARFSRSMPLDMVARVLGVMGLVSVGFYAFLLFTSNPFERLLPGLVPHSHVPAFPVDGGDLNPLLQDFGLIIHPPLLYMGYVGFSVAFGFAVAGLLSGQLDSAWARWSRPWTTVAWCFLTLGIALGSWWAYYELGWGGWWFWDPVENASLMPWLSGTALLHSLAVTEKRGVFKAWTVLLAILTFSLSLLGTFLVRSGVLTSVHAFANDPERGLFILVFLCLTVGCSLLLFAFRAVSLRAESSYQLVSREVFLLANNIVFLCATLVVLTGTLFPLLFDVFGWGKISVGPPYFNLLFIPLAMVIMTLTAVGPFMNWKRNALAPWRQPVVISIVLSAAVTVLFLAGFGFALTPVTFLTSTTAFWVVGYTLWDLFRKMATAKAGWWAGWQRLSLSYRGMVVAHLGMAITVLGICVVASSDVEQDVRLAPGDTVSMAGHRFVFEKVTAVSGPNYDASRATVHVYRGDALVTHLYPEKRHYFVKGTVMTEAAISPGMWRDLYVSLGEPLGDGSWAVRVYYKPLMRWVWGGAAIMALGGFLAIADRRYRLALRRRTGPAVAAEGETV